MNDKITGLLKDIERVKKELKEIKKSIKSEEKVQTAEYEQLKKAFADIKAQIKGLEESWLQGLKENIDYNHMRELKVKKEEELAVANLKLFEVVSTLPKDAVSFNLTTDTGVVTVQILPEMRVYMDGKEEKKRGL